MEKPQTAEQFNRERGVANTGKELPTLGGVQFNPIDLKDLPREVEKLIQQARTEVAREIFEEVECHFNLAYPNGEALQSLKDRFLKEGK